MLLMLAIHDFWAKSKPSNSAPILEYIYKPNTYESYVNNIIHLYKNRTEFVTNQDRKEILISLSKQAYSTS